MEYQCLFFDKYISIKDRVVKGEMIGEIEIYKNRDMNISEEEDQSTEWKWSWNDDFLKWLCGYANMDGGILYVGVNDNGYVVGLKIPERFLNPCLIRLMIN